jgi:hypothetical protein
MSERLGENLRGQVDLSMMRRYYSEVRQPDCEGVIPNAHNQVSFYLVPFIEPFVIREAYKATPYIGVSGRFQAQMIARLAPALAKIPSHYGFSFDNEPIGHRLYAAIRGYTPDRFWLMRNHIRIRYLDLGKYESEKYDELKNRSKLIREIEEALYDAFQEVDWRICMRHYAQRPTALFLGAFFREFQSNITF